MIDIHLSARTHTHTHIHTHTHTYTRHTCTPTLSAHTHTHVHTPHVHTRSVHTHTRTHTTHVHVLHFSVCYSSIIRLACNKIAPYCCVIFLREVCGTKSFTARMDTPTFQLSAVGSMTTKMYRNGSVQTVREGCHFGTCLLRL